MRSVIASKINLLQIAMAILFFKIAYNLLCSEMLMGGLCIPKSILQQWFVKNLRGKQNALWLIGK